MADSPKFQADADVVSAQLSKLAVEHDVGVLLIFVHKGGGSHQVSNLSDEDVRTVAQVYAEGAPYKTPALPLRRDN